VRRNNNVRIHGQLAQETVEVLAVEPKLLVRVAVDTDTPERGGRHWVLFEEERAQDLAAYLAASMLTDAPMVVVVIGSLVHEHSRSVVTDLEDVSYGVFRLARRRAEELQRQGGLRLTRGRPYELRPAGYHTCIYAGGVLDLRSISAREHTGADDGVAMTVTLETGGPAAFGRHELMLPTRRLQAPRAGARPPREVEANVCGTLYTENGYTRVVVTGIDLPELVAQVV
jgi:hypothetical protein